MELALFLLVLLAPAPGSQDSAPASEVEPPQPAPPWVIDVADDGSCVAVARKDGVVELWDPVELEPLEVLEPALGTSPWAIALSPNGSRLAVLGEDGRVATWDFAEPDAEPSEPDEGSRGNDLQQVWPARESLTGFRFGAAVGWSPDGERIVLVESEGNALLCDARARVEARWTISPMFGTPPFAFTADGRHVLTSKGERVEVRDVTTGREVPKDYAVRSISTGSDVIALAVHPTRNLVVTGHERSHAFLWDLSSGELVREHAVPDPWLPEDDDEVAGAAFSPDGRFLALSIRQGSHVFLLDVDTGEQLWMSEFFGAHFSEPFELAWSPDSSRVWFTFACGFAEIGSHAVSADARADPYQGDGLLPRFGGELGLTVAWVEDVLRVMPVHPRQ